ncbi:hypothetical protein BH23CHL4_BH23CHL4_30430 [soil metagenome]
MARNRVQFQKGLSEPEFDRLYGSEEQCRAIVAGKQELHAAATSDRNPRRDT